MPIEETGSKKSVPEGLWTKCSGCDQIVYNKELQENLKVCPKCQHHMRLSAPERIELLVDAGSFKELDADLEAVDTLHFTDAVPYEQRLKDTQGKLHVKDAIMIGNAKIEGRDIVLGVQDFRFMGGSMGAVVGEKVTRAAERSFTARAPLILVSASGGARMQESVSSLMQMAKASAAIRRLQTSGIPYISLLSDPTTGGVTASFAMLGDLIFAEPGALIGFAGPRVIEQTIRQTLPPGFQRAEFLLKHGLIDRVIPRPELRTALARCLRYFERSSKKKTPSKRK
jgi:acetyl-CoA carboxylase carboxyl transferase subunit beta